MPKAKSNVVSIDSAEDKPLSKREARKERIHREIVQTAYRLFVENGFEDTKIDDIIKEVGVARRTFFSYFPSRTHLLNYFSMEMVRVTRLKLLSYSNNNWSTERRLRTYFNYSVKSLKKANSFGLTLLQDAVMTLPAIEIRDSSNEFEGIQEAFAELLREGYENGELTNEFSLNFLAQTVNGIYNSVVIAWINDPHYPIDARMKQAAKVAYRAIKK